MSGRMVMWLFLSMGLMVALYFYHQKKTEGGDLDVEFSNFYMFFDPIKGEGDVFVGGILILLFFSFFLLELARTFRSLFIL